MKGVIVGGDNPVHFITTDKLKNLLKNLRIEFSYLPSLDSEVKLDKWKPFINNLIFSDIKFKNVDEIIMYLKDFLDLDSEQVYKKMRIDMNFRSYFLDRSLARFFNVLKNFIEKLILKYIITYSNEKNDIKKYVNYWETYLENKNIISSSVLLYGLNKTPSLTFIDNRKSKKSIKLQKKIDNFEYKGYCPKIPVDRIIALLEFPIEEIFDFFIGNSNNPLNEIDQSISDIFKKVKSEKLSYKLPNTNNKLEIINFLVKLIISRLEYFLSDFKKHEDMEIEVSNKLNHLSDKLESNDYQI